MPNDGAPFLMDESPLLTAKEALKLLPATTAVTISTIYRWGNQGVIVNGKLCRLHTKRIGGRIYTKEEWLGEFFKAVNAAEPSLPRKRLDD